MDGGRISSSSRKPTSRPISLNIGEEKKERASGKLHGLKTQKKEEKKANRKYHPAVNRCEARQPKFRGSAPPSRSGDIRVRGHKEKE